MKARNQVQVIAIGYDRFQFGAAVAFWAAIAVLIVVANFAA